MPDLSLMAKVLSDYAKGKDSLNTVAKRHGTSDDTIRRWALENAEAYGLYARARHISAGAFEDEALEIAKRADATSYNADRLRIDTLKWAAAKRYPKEYGDRQETQVNVSLAGLHLDAMRKVTAVATVASDYHIALPKQPENTPLEADTVTTQHESGHDDRIEG